MERLGRLKADSVWKIIDTLDEPLLTTAKILSAMPVTQVSVERLFSSMKFILSDHRASMKQDLLDAILFLRANGQLDEETIGLMESMRSQKTYLNFFRTHVAFDFNVRQHFLLFLAPVCIHLSVFFDRSWPICKNSR